MDKQELLNQIRSLSSQQLLTKEELVNAYLEGQGKLNDATRSLKLSDVLYYVGGAIIFLGIAFFVGMNWSLLTTATKLLVTLGAAIAAYGTGLAFVRRKDLEGIGNAFFLISALLAPIGMFVLFDNLGLDTSQSSIQAVMSAIIFLAYFLSWWIMRRVVFQVFLFTFGTWLFFSVCNLVINGGNTYPSFDTTAFFEYRYLVTGLAYMLFGYWFSKREDSSLSGPLYGFGSLFFLGAALGLGNWSVETANLFWQIIYPGLIFGAVVASVHLRSKVLLTFGVIFLMIYLIKLTAIYFHDSQLWPLALVLVGLLIMAIGYYAVYIGKRYLSKNAPEPQKPFEMQ